ncbi:MAG: hypothetical protein DLM66_09580 [Candidatus Dormiibacter spiritus]|nr:MAG: hypothetical protein DLM66_09580 [Candidatus Dormibacteraeota bacterium]
MTVPIAIVDYDPEWPRRYEAEAKRLRAKLGPVALRLEHVGSTAVPGLRAKDIVDIQLSVAALEPMQPYRAPLERLAYEYVVTEPEDHRFFRLERAGRRLFHLHVCQAEGEWERRHIVFRDHLRSHPEAAAAYERHKLELAPHFDIANDYAEAKDPFIRRLEREIGGSQMVE